MTIPSSSAMACCRSLTGMKPSSVEDQPEFIRAVHQDVGQQLAQGSNLVPMGHFS